MHELTTAEQIILFCGLNPLFTLLILVFSFGLYLTVNAEELNKKMDM